RGGCGRRRGTGARVMGSEIDYDLMTLDLNLLRVMMEASPDTFTCSSGMRSSTLTSEFNLLLPIIFLAAPHDQQVSCRALLFASQDFQLKEYESQASARRASRAMHLRNGIHSGNTSRNEFRCGRRILP
ncbi:MAG TPA: hypothetical protein VNO32_66245, partial [Candidatus Acidoferrum sp.]|nr:hypothetical protein [Candidatus Acidoferrum sp.]